METCPFCNLQYKRKDEHNHALTNAHFAANIEYKCQQGKGMKNLADKRFHLQSNEQKIIRKLNLVLWDMQKRYKN